MFLFVFETNNKHILFIDSTSFLDINEKNLPDVKSKCFYKKKVKCEFHKIVFNYCDLIYRASLIIVG